MNMMFYALDVILRLTHPFMPFLTEGLWQELDPKSRAEVDGTSIMLSPFPNTRDFPEISSSQKEPMEHVLELVDAMRRYGASTPGKGTEKPVAILPPKGSSLADYLKEKRETLSLISRVEVEEVLDEAERERVVSVQTASGGSDRWGMCLLPVDSSVEGQMHERPIFVCLR